MQIETTFFFSILFPIDFSPSLLSFSSSGTMGVKGLLKELSGGDTKACTRVGFSSLEILRSRLVDIITGTLVFVCALRHKEAHNRGRYLPACRKFQRKTTLAGPGPGQGGDCMVPRVTCGRRSRSCPKVRVWGTHETNSPASREGAR